MKTLQRYGKTSSGATYALVDNLTMTYSGNQLVHAADAVTNPAYSESADFKDKVSATGTIEYTYTANGAMNKDLNKGISDIQYNSLNLPQVMIINSPTAKAKNYYTYSASGVKLRTEQRYDPNYTVTPSNATNPTNDGLADYKNTDYVGNIVYETVKSGSTITNRTRILVDGGYYEGGVYYFYLTDHLGNNRVVVNQSGTVTQKNHYYPFGTAFADKYDNGTNQPYKYNGKELDGMHQLNLYDYSARYYESALGRFTSVDPLAEKYYSISPYVYVMNNPLKFIDPDGRDIKIYYQSGGKNYAFIFNGSNYTAAPKNEFVQKALQAYKYNVVNGGGESMYTLANSREMTVNLVESEYSRNTHSSGTVFWDTQHASKTAEGHMRSPATNLEHEMGHAESYMTDTKGHIKRASTYDKQYDTAEERRVITGTEAKTAQANGEYPKGYTRKDHDYHGTVKVNDVTKTTPTQQSQQQTQNQVQQQSTLSLWEKFKKWWNE